MHSSPGWAAQHSPAAPSTVRDDGWHGDCGLRRSCTADRWGSRRAAFGLQNREFQISAKAHIYDWGGRAATRVSCRDRDLALISPGRPHMHVDVCARESRVPGTPPGTGGSARVGRPAADLLDIDTGIRAQGGVPTTGRVAPKCAIPNVATMLRHTTTGCCH